MIIMGVDPGLARTGWAVLSVNKDLITALAYGCIVTDKKDQLGDRLAQIHQKISAFLKKFNPDYLVLEELFFAKNAKTIIPVGEARGVILLGAAQANVNVVSYTPLTVKQTICGWGKAQKPQVQKMVTRLLHLTKIPTPDDTADALAIALTHAYSYKMKGALV